MISLTFGEQVKIVLSRKDMTIKELAEEIEARTGKKMSRQNLTQRLGRDNFQEQDMRMIADILGCPFQLSILGNADSEKEALDEEEMPTGRELEKLTAKKERKAAREEAKQIEEELQEPEQEIEAEVVEEAGAEEIPEETSEAAYQEEAEPQEEAYQEQPAYEENQPETCQKEENPVVEEAETEDVHEEKNSPFSKLTKLITPKKEKKSSGWPQDFQPIKRREDIDEDLVNGDVNPYTGHEYRTNSVRMHPHRIGYVQVYDRKDHKWTDMTEWAFLGVEERKKATMGKDYEPPIYLD